MFTFRGIFTKQIWVWKGGFQLMQILGLLGMFFDAVVVEVKKKIDAIYQKKHTVVKNLI